MQRFYDVGDELEAAYGRGEFGKAEALARENLDLAIVYRCNWNYGNAVHDSYRILGLINLKSGDLDTASDDLRQAGESTGSPQLNTFGPELDLADALLQRDKGDVVKAYLLNIKRFWREDDGNIDRWVAQIDRGEKPKLERFQASPPAFGVYLLSGLATLWPAIVSAALLALRRKHLSRKLLFFGLSTAIGYLVMFAGGFIMGLVGTSIMLACAQLGIPAGVSVSIPIVILMSLPIVTALMVARHFRAKPPVTLAGP